MNKNKILMNFLVVLTLCSCTSGISGEWYDYTLTEKVISADNRQGSTPFNTAMRLRYFKNDNNSETINNENVEKITNIFKNEVIRLHKLFDRHYNYTISDDSDELIANIKVINDSYASGNEIKVSDEVFDLIKYGIEYTKLTKGYFNFLAGGLTSYWDSLLSEYEGLSSLENDPYYNENSRNYITKLVSAIPTYEEIDEVLVLNEENKTVVFNKYENEYDFRPSITVGAIAKGFATDIVKEKINAAGFYEGILYSGGSSISSLGTPIYTNKIGQKINIVNPNGYSWDLQTAFSFALKEEFNVSTSGNYTTGKSYWFIPETDNKVIYRHHIINPLTGYPENYYRSVTLVSTSFSAMSLDALSTALTNMPVNEGMILRNKLLEENLNHDLEIMYLSQEGSQYQDYTLSVIATSDIGGTLTVEKGVNLQYES